MANKQLYEKSGEEYVEVFPLTHTENVTDTNSGKNLDELFQDTNHMYLTYTTDAATTRLTVPSSRRRFGLWISYMKDNALYTEAYIGTTTNVDTDSVWSSDSNWQEVKTDGGSVDISDISVSDAQSIVDKAITGQSVFVNNCLRTALGTLSQIEFTDDFNATVNFTSGHTVNVAILGLDTIAQNNADEYITAKNIVDKLSPTLTTEVASTISNVLGTITLGLGENTYRRTLTIPAVTANGAGVVPSAYYSFLSNYGNMINAIGSLIYQAAGNSMNNSLLDNINYFKNGNYASVQ